MAFSFSFSLLLPPAPQFGAVVSFGFLTGITISGFRSGIGCFGVASIVRITLVNLPVALPSAPYAVDVGRSQDICFCRDVSGCALRAMTGGSCVPSGRILRLIYGSTKTSLALYPTSTAVVPAPSPSDHDHETTILGFMCCLVRTSKAWLSKRAHRALAGAHQPETQKPVIMEVCASRPKIYPNPCKLKHLTM